MAKHCCKILILLVPSVATLCLLTYCILSDTWITIDQSKLDNLTRMYDSDYNVYLNQVNLLTSKSSKLTEEKQQQQQQQEDDNNSENDDDDYELNESTDENNLFNQKSANDMKKNKQQEALKDQTTNRPNYVYITKLWPFKKSKSLYSDCVEYKQMKLKLSVSYLTSDRKEPIIGTIHYFDSKFDSKESSCNEKTGMIKCLFTQQCRVGKSCDGVVDCEDQSDEQMCDENRTCQFKNGITGFKCDNKCWQYWNKCDQIPHCFNLTDEVTTDCSNYLMPIVKTTNETDTSFLTSLLMKTNVNLLSFTLGANYFDQKSKCFKNYFNFKSAKLINKDSLKYLSQPLADNIQEMNNINYHLQLIYNLSFLASLFFTILALMSLLFILCFKKMCFQCPFWFFGFFQIVSWMTCLFGLMTFLYQFYSNKQKSLDPLVQLPIDNELLRLNTGLLEVEKLGISFWLAVAATSTSFLSSLLSCLVCCRLPSSRHEDKEYKIMQLPTYS